MTRLAVGMTIGLRRVKGKTFNYAQQAITSFRTVGFTEPLHVFVEPGAEVHLPKSRYGLVVHSNKRKLGCFRNFKRAATHLTGCTDAEWLLLLQDDAIWRADGATLLYTALESFDAQSVGFISPYTSKAMIGKKHLAAFAKRRADSPVRWVPCKFYNNAFWGAVALCFPRASMLKMQAHKRYTQHKHHRKLDVVVGNVMRDLRLPMFVALPSVVDHIGRWSTLGRHRLKSNQWGRHGFAFKP